MKSFRQPGQRHKTKQNLLSIPGVSQFDAVVQVDFVLNLHNS